MKKFFIVVDSEVTLVGLGDTKESAKKDAENKKIFYEKGKEKQKKMEYALLHI